MSSLILIRRFAQALNILVKTDKIDAQVIAKFAVLIKPESMSTQTDIARDLIARRRQLLSLIKEDKNRLAIMPKEIQPIIKATLSATRLTLQSVCFINDWFQQGEPKKVALTARMRKFLTVFNAIVRAGTAWNEKVLQTT